MSNNQVNKARQYSLKTSPNAITKDIYVIVRVFDLNTETKKERMHLYVDPWRLYLEQKLSLEARDCFAVSPAGWRNPKAGWKEL
jgi:sulfate adenylyltransferase subunit 1 (EFTu-like GTPase family)